jgi:hypothetical protein
MNYGTRFEGQAGQPPTNWANAAWLGGAAQGNHPRVAGRVGPQVLMNMGSAAAMAPGTPR